MNMNLNNIFICYTYDRITNRFQISLKFYFILFCKFFVQEKEKAKEPRKKVGFIAVSIGEGLNEIFKELGVDYIIEGGQTMNPSTEDMLTAIDHVNADYIYILPNNKNIVMAANQARDLTEDKDIINLHTG